MKGYGCERLCEALQKARNYADKLYKENLHLKQQIAELQKGNKIDEVSQNEKAMLKLR